MAHDTSSTTAPSKVSVWLLLSCTTANVYLLGAACLLQFVAYPLLGTHGSGGLSGLHAALTGHLGGAFILPEFVAFGLVLPLFYWRPQQAQPRNLWICLALGIVYFAVTFGWHLPAHKLLALGDASAMSALLASHAVRTTSLAIKCGFLLSMVAREIRP